MLVDEVEPEKAMAVGAPSVAQSGEDMPRRGDGEEEDGSGEGAQTSPLGELARPEKKREDGAEDEDERDQAFGENGECESCPEQIRPDRLW